MHDQLRTHVLAGLSAEVGGGCQSDGWVPSLAGVWEFQMSIHCIALCESLWAWLPVKCKLRKVDLKSSTGSPAVL